MPTKPGGCNRSHIPKGLEHPTGLPNPQPSHKPPMPGPYGHLSHSSRWLSGKKEWGAEILFSRGSTNARGVAVLIKNSSDIDIMMSQTDSSGRLLLFKALIKEENYTIAKIGRASCRERV